MDLTIKALKIVLLIIAIFIGVGILGGMYFVYMGYKSGDMKTYVTETAVDNFVDDSKLSPEQKEMLDEGDYDGLAESIGDNITDEQINCAISAVGEARARELLVTKDPTPLEVVKLSKCL